MKELQYPQNITLECGLVLRPYIRLEEKKIIVEELVKIENELDRDYALNCLLLQILCDDNAEYDYDLLVANNIFEQIRAVVYRDINDINNCVDRQFDTYYVVKNFLDSTMQLANKLEKKIPSQKKLEKALDSLKVISDGNTNK